MGANCANCNCKNGADELECKDKSRKVCEWKVIYARRCPVHREKLVDASKVKGTKKPGEIVRGWQDGDWVVLVDEPGFIRIVGASSGALVLEMVNDNVSSSPWRPVVEAFPVSKESVQPGGFDSNEDQGLWADDCAVEDGRWQDDFVEKEPPLESQSPTVEKFTVIVEKGGTSKRLGLETTALPEDQCLRIRKIHSDGLVADWNASYPSAEVCPGDRIVAVNGTVGGKEALYKVLGVSTRFALVIHRFIESSAVHPLPSPAEIFDTSGEKRGGAAVDVEPTGSVPRGPNINVNDGLVSPKVEPPPPMPKVEKPPPVPAVYIVMLEKDKIDSPIGLDLEQLGLTPRVRDVTEGPVMLYNMSAAESMRVSPGDFLIEVNGQHATLGMSRMVDRLYQEKRLQIKFARPIDFSVTLRRGDHRSLGFGIDYMDHGACLLVTVLSSGPVEEWNRENKEKAIKEQDRIVAVNGVSGSARLLLGALKGSGTFELTVIRPAQEAKR